MANVVWILGAGFSRSLGGPLLADLFTLSSRRRRKRFFPHSDFPLLDDKHARHALRLYEDGCKSENGVLWHDPEEFLEQLDTAATLGEQSATWRVFTDLLHEERVDIRELTIAARRLLAADCSMFLRENNPSWERWRPYKKWASQLNGNDVIITFNYDLVPDILAKGGAPIAFPLPGQEYSPPSHTARVLKLHGSVNWRRLPSTALDEPPRYDIVENDHFAIQGPAKQILIAGPGPAKTATVKDLESLWQEAERQLQNCIAAVFIGYHIPKSDAEARDRILSALRKNPDKVLRIFVVLGRTSPDVDGLVEMVRVALRVPSPERQIRSYSLYGEEFLSCYEVNEFREGIRLDSERLLRGQRPLSSRGF